MAEQRAAATSIATRVAQLAEAAHGLQQLAASLESSTRAIAAAVSSASRQFEL